jgi:formylglycine-generating enzyme required for sulfatase activity
MRAPLIRLGCLLSLLIATSASAVSMAWTAIGNPGNANDNTGFGAVGYAYSIGSYEVTNAQYAEFLNAKAAADPLGLYSTDMGIVAPTPTSAGHGGITRSGGPGSFTYNAIPGRENLPVNYVSFYDALRFANWLHNGQGSGDTESGAYTLLGGTPEPSNGNTVMRNIGARIFLTSENEWYKAAYYKATSTSYFAYPTGSDIDPTCAVPSATPNTANCGNAVGDLTPGGSYTGSASPYGTFDQGGNVWEWNEAIFSLNGIYYRRVRGADFTGWAGSLAASARSSSGPLVEDLRIGFRVAPEPGRDFLLVTGALGLLGLAGWRRDRSCQ